MTPDFANDDRLREQVEQVLEDRRRLGLEGMVGGLECVVVCTERDRLVPAAKEFLDTTGYHFHTAFEDHTARNVVLKQEGGADFLFINRKGRDNPFRAVNAAPRTEHLPDTRLETFVFKCPDLEHYVDIQRGRGRKFMTDEIIETDTYLFIQTRPSPYTGNSLGFIKWLGEEGAYAWEGAAPWDLTLAKPDKPHLANIHELDHTATRVRASERDAAILEFMDYTNYDFDFAIYVESLNSITSVARLSEDDYAQVFTSGIAPFKSLEESGPTEKYIHNHGTRVHHMAFRTEDIEDTYQAFKDEGMGFLVELVGGPDEGLHQTFTEPSPHTLLVTEYIRRYGDFDGFFTRSNVTELTRATDKQ